MVYLSSSIPITLISLVRYYPCLTSQQPRLTRLRFDTGDRGRVGSIRDSTHDESTNLHYHTRIRYTNRKLRYPRQQESPPEARSNLTENGHDHRIAGSRDIRFDGASGSVIITVLFHALREIQDQQAFRAWSSEA